VPAIRHDRRGAPLRAPHPVERRPSARRGALVVLLLLALATAAHAAPTPRVVDLTTFAGPAPEIRIDRTRTGWILEAANPAGDRSVCPCLTIATPRGYVLEITISEIIAWPPPIVYLDGIEIARGLPIGLRVVRAITITAGPATTEVSFPLGDIFPGQSLLVAQITLRRNR
jgi:hypothetical protein